MYNSAAHDIAISFFNNELLMFIAFAATFTVAGIDRSMGKHQRRLTYSFALLCMFYTLLTFIDFSGATGMTSAGISVRMACATLRNILKPLMLTTVISALPRQIMKTRWLYIPFAVNAVLSLVNVWTHWCYGFTEDNEFATGPLYFVGIVIFYMYLIILTITYLRYPLIDTFKLRFTTVLIISLIAIAEVGELMADRNSLGTAILISIILEYELLIVLKNNAQLKNKEESLEKQKGDLIRSKMDSISDGMTGLLNRRAYDLRIERESGKTDISGDFTVVMCDINGLKYANDNFGHKAGDALITGTSKCIKAAFGKYGNIYRIGGDEFTALINCSESELEAAVAALDSLCKNWADPLVDELAVSIGYARISDHPGMSVNDLTKVADQRMYGDKQEYYRKNPERDRRNTVK